MKEVRKRKKKSYVNAQKWNLDRWCRWSCLQSRNRHRGVESKCMNTKWEREGRRNWEIGPTHIHYWYYVYNRQGFPGCSEVKKKKKQKNLPASAEASGDVSSISGSGRSPGRGRGNPLQYSCLENPMDRGAWRAAVQRATAGHDWSDLARTEWLVRTCCTARGALSDALWRPERESADGRPYMYMCDGLTSLHGRNSYNVVKQVYSNKN